MSIAEYKLKPEASAVMLKKLGYQGNSMQADEVNAFLASNPNAQATLGQWTTTAEKRLKDLKAKPITSKENIIGYAEGGTTISPNQGKLDAAQQRLSDAQAKAQEARAALAANPGDAALAKAAQSADAAIAVAQDAVNTATASMSQTDLPSSVELKTAAIKDPGSLVTGAKVDKIAQTPDQLIASGTGQAGAVDKATTTTATTATPVADAAPITVEKTTATTAKDATQATIDKLTAATGKPSAEALAEAATMDPAKLSSLGLTVDQIKEAQKVVGPAPLKVTEDQLISGSTVDMGAVDKAVNFEAATGAPSTAGTVQGQLTGLMQDFEGGATPAWAAGAMRAATAALASRGLGASSMAGQAIIQATMESALPIAQQDAQTNVQFELQNLSNKQATAMFGAEQRAKFLGLDFDQKFQAKVANAARISDVANINFSAEQQIALENARMAQTVDIANLDARNAKIMADAASMTQLDLTNLSNTQQAAVENAKTFLQMDMANLDNMQQTAVFKTQAMINTLLSDQAAENASAQFNASSTNQTNQFMASMQTQIQQFNNTQADAMSKFNAGETNAVAQFNTAQINARDQFNSANQLVVAQANAQWQQTIATIDNASTNQANRDAAIAANGMTTLAYNNMMQQERDVMQFYWQTGENDADRAAQLVVAKMTDQTSKDAASASKNSQFWQVAGTIAAAWIGTW